MMEQINRKWLVAEYPEGMPTEATFELVKEPAPEADKGEVVVRNLWLSVDPYMRGRISDAPSYAAPVPVGEVMVGGTVGQVVASNSELLRVGEIVVTMGGWQDYRVLSPAAQEVSYRIGRTLPLSTALGPVGMPGCTAYFGLLKLGKPQAGETLVVSAAAGAVGSAVGQIGKLHGCRVVGIAGGPEKCGLCTDVFGFDACIDYKAESDLREALAAVCPDGIDIYFENVGGPVLQAVMPLLKDGARVPVCGYISQYNERGAAPPPWEVIRGLDRRVECRFFVVTEWTHEMPKVRRQLTDWVVGGDLKYRETIARGLERAPAAFIGLLNGENIGKQVVRVAALA